MVLLFYCPVVHVSSISDSSILFCIFSPFSLFPSSPFLTSLIFCIFTPTLYWHLLTDDFHCHLLRFALLCSLARARSIFLPKWSAFLSISIVSLLFYVIFWPEHDKHSHVFYCFPSVISDYCFLVHKSWWFSFHVLNDWWLRSFYYHQWTNLFL